MSLEARPGDRHHSGLRVKLAFVACGAIGFAIYTTASLLLLRSTALHAETAALLAVVIAVPPTFLLQKRVAFRHQGDTLGAFLKYCALQAVNAVLIAVLARLGRQAGLPDALNVVASGALVVMVSWVALSRSVFHPRDQPR